MMKRDLIVFEHERFELTGYDVWMTAGEIASLFGVTIMKVRGIVSRMRKQLTVNLDLLSKYDLLENGYKDELFSLEVIVAMTYYVDTGLAHEFRRWICDRITRRKERAMIVYF
ncbi:MAG: hypothetical protein AUK63_2045 [bacterium P3]|nr:MAG: hypothetical protein AUK63_2045 [bacterium P3]KWW34543.1 MAG: hypothetical protein F083_2457 [bacterium F083]